MLVLHLLGVCLLSVNLLTDQRTPRLIHVKELYASSPGPVILDKTLYPALDFVKSYIVFKRASVSYRK